MQKKYAKSYIKDYGNPKDGYLLVESYDGSCQVVHPDFIKRNGKLWLVCTPYPYGCNKCENPSVYTGDSVEDLAPACKNPIDFPAINRKGSILSDPCFFEQGEKLYICYRERLQRKGHVEYNLYAKSSIDGSTWEDKTLIKSTVTTDGDPLISPAIMEYVGTNYLYHVRAKGLGGDIVLSKLNDRLEAVEIKTLNCQGLPEDHLIWHIGLHSDCYTKSVSKEGLILGLFTVRSKSGNKVYKAHQNSPEEDWVIDKKIEIPDSIKTNCRELYKCSYTPDGRIALSFFDMKNRLVIKIIENC